MQANGLPTYSELEAEIERQSRRSGRARATVTRRGDAILTVPTSRQLVRLAVTS